MFPDAGSEHSKDDNENGTHDHATDEDGYGVASISWGFGIGVAHTEVGLFTNDVVAPPTEANSLEQFKESRQPYPTHTLTSALPKRDEPKTN